MKFFTVIISLLLLVSCDKKDTNKIRFYISTDSKIYEKIIKDFERETRLEVEIINENVDSANILNNFTKEDIADVFWVENPIKAEYLKINNLLEKFTPDISKGIVKSFKDKDDSWIGFSASTIVYICNVKNVQNDLLPDSIFDLLNTEYKGKIATVINDSILLYFSSLSFKTGINKTKELLDNIVTISSFDVLKDKLNNGEFLCVLSTNNKYFSEFSKNENMKMFIIDQKKGLGTQLVPNVVGLLKTSKNQENGKKLLRYLLSRETEITLCKSNGLIPLHKGVKTEKQAIEFDKLKYIKVDYSKIVENLDKIKALLQK